MPTSPKGSGRPLAAAAVNIGLKLTGILLAFGLQIALARVMSPAEFAALAVLQTWVIIGTASAGFSMPLVILRFLPQYLQDGEHGRARGLLRHVLRVTSLGSIAAATLVVGLTLALGTDMPSAAVALAGLFCVVSTLQSVLIGLLQALKRVLITEIVSNAARAALVLVGVWLWWRMQPAAIDAAAVFAVQIVATLVTALACVAVARRARPVEMRRAVPQEERRLWWGTAGGYTLVLLAAVLNERIDMVVLAWSAAPHDVATYAVATRFSQTLLMASTAVTAMLAPLLSERAAAVRAGDVGEAQALIRRMGRLMLGLAVAGVVVLWAAGPQLVALFGADYAGARWPIVVLCLGLCASAVVGPAGFAASMLGKPRIAVVGLACGAILNVLLNLWLVPRHGPLGAAWATAAGFLAGSLVSWALMRREMGIDTMVWRPARTLAAARA